MDDLAEDEFKPEQDQMERLDDELDRFLIALAEADGYARNTVSAYRNDLNQLVDWLKQRLPPVAAWPEVSTEVLSEFTDYMYTLQVVKSSGAVKPVAPSTVARKIAAIKSFFSYLAASGAVVSDPSKVLATPKIAKRIPRTMASQDIERLLAAPGSGNSPKVLRDHALLKLLYATGMRVSELVALQLADVDLAQRQVHVRSEDGGKERPVPITEAAALAVQLYLDRGRAGLVKHESALATLFLNQRGQSLTRQGVWLIIKEYAAKVGLSYEVTPHVLRHSFAAHTLRDHKASLSEIQRVLGHAHISTTQIYMQTPAMAATGEVETPAAADPNLAAEF
jgi:integrase/recombinase XerD